MKKYLEANAAIREALAAADEALGNILAACGDMKIELNENRFESLVSSIVGQQLSNRVVEVIWGRVTRLTGGEITPENILNTGEEAFRQTGMSRPKIRYIKNLAEAVLSGAVELDAFDDMENKDIIQSLAAVKGIGEWTAEMFLVFSLGREDVFSAGDGGLQRAVKKLYALDDIPPKPRLLEISEKWKPYRTYASLYLWRSLDNMPAKADSLV